MKIRNRNTARATAALGTSIALVAGSAVLATPAYADSDDIVVTKLASVAGAQAGDTVTYSVEVRGSDFFDPDDFFASQDTNVQIHDELPPHTTFVPGSASVTFNEVSSGAALHLVPNSYAGGSGWTGPWIETNDDGDEDAGDLQAGVIALRFRNPSGDLPYLTRTVDPAGTVRSVAFSFVSADLFTGANDQVVAEMSFDGGATWPESQIITGGEGTDVHTLTAEGIAADTITVRFRVLTTGTWGLAQAILISGVSVFYAYDTSSTTTALVDGDILDVDGNITVGSWDVSYAETVILTYDAVIDSVIPDSTLELTNTATVTSDDDPAGEVAQSTVTLTRHPALEFNVTHTAAPSIGAPVDVTAVVSHSAASDGAPVCGFELHADVPAPTAFTYVSGDSDDDGCLDHGESWTLTKTMMGATANAGLHSITLRGVGIDPHDAAFEATSDLTFTVVLAESGPEDMTGLAVTSTGLALLGVGLIVSTRRRPI
jgi:hypothetical protein